MSRNTSVSLNDDVLAFIEAEVAQGHYSIPGDVMNASLRLLAAQ
jgi:Arc/MetJ-type ribon-helix-helix transcriptional regulator